MRDVSGVEIGANWVVGEGVGLGIGGAGVIGVWRRVLVI